MKRKVGAVIAEKFYNEKIFESDTSLLKLAIGIKRALKELSYLTDRLIL